MEGRSGYPSEWAAITSVAEKIGCKAETLRKWVRQAERDSGKREGLTTTDRERLKQLEPIGHVPPVEFESAYYRSQSTPAMVAGLM